MANNIQTGAGVQYSLAITGQTDLTSGSNLTITPHTGATGPNITHALAATDTVAPTLQVNQLANHGGSTGDVGLSFDLHPGWYEIPLRAAMGGGAPLGPVTIGPDATISSTSDATNHEFTDTDGTDFSAFAALVPCPVRVIRDGASPLDTHMVALAVEDAGATLVVGKGTATGVQPFDQEFGEDIGTVVAGDNVTIHVEKVWKAGTLEEYLLMEGFYPNVGGSGQYYANQGLFVTSLALAAAKGSAPNWTMSAGSVGYAGATATFGTGSYDTYATFDPYENGEMWRYRGVGGVFGNKDPSDPTGGFLVGQMPININTNAIPTQAGGSDLPCAHSRGRMQVTGTADLFFSGAATREREKQRVKARTSLYAGWDRTSNGVRNGFAYWVPQAKYSAMPTGGEGNGSQLNFSSTWEAYNDGSIGGAQGSLAVFADFIL